MKVTVKAFTGSLYKFKENGLRSTYDAMVTLLLVFMLS